MKVLIVADTESLRDLLVRALNYLPALASHGKDGLEKAIAERPDLLIPVMDGWDAARALRANAEQRIFRF